MKVISVFILVLLLAQAASAGPHPIRWAKRHPFIVKEGAAIMGASIHAYGLAHCRRGDVERCDAGYGAAWGTFGMTTGLSTLVFVPLSEKCDHEDQGRAFCGVIALGLPAGQALWGIHEYRQYRPEGVHPNLMVNFRQ
jgi:hypothetical protein